MLEHLYTISRKAFKHSRLGALVGASALLSVGAAAAGTTPADSGPPSQSVGQTVTAQNSAAPLVAQVDNHLILVRAKNEARQAAERLNGGLNEYRAESAMHGSILQVPYVDNNDGTVTFTFRGGNPADVAAGIYSVESIITVDVTSWETVIDYNGDLRTDIAADTPPSTIQPDFVSRANDHFVLVRAKNEARQAAERLNGGLGSYRAEPAMHGDVNQAPYVINQDGSITFTFQGGSPSQAANGNYPIESVVTVDNRDRSVVVDYNGPIRESAS
ncbi:hypothetical protein IQ241_06860 [Romeria aff. gracilis LEGE 07310]|uniref:Uncharacterized protein n=1 Tax=Vasconcelosia minhoensis LEGE 07310 TaxID=915328 RepID=A0A8J7AM83_9CYAN|nr:hypothetical protein [Romeria gracilis]MBE9077019.1 hypothetical protein [Romeria aff. gracilis LEGE 07310]